MVGLAFLVNLFSELWSGDRVVALYWGVGGVKRSDLG